MGNGGTQAGSLGLTGLRGTISIRVSKINLCIRNRVEFNSITLFGRTQYLKVCSYTLLGSWVKIKPSSKLGISGGIPLREYSKDESWDTEDEGFALSMHHQIHCLVYFAPNQKHHGRFPDLQKIRA